MEAGVAQTQVPGAEAASWLRWRGRAHPSVQRSSEGAGAGSAHMHSEDPGGRGRALSQEEKEGCVLLVTALDLGHEGGESIGTSSTGLGGKVKGCSSLGLVSHSLA